MISTILNIAFSVFLFSVLPVYYVLSSQKGPKKGSEEWKDRRLEDWANRRLPVFDEREDIRNALKKEYIRTDSFQECPYLMIDAIIDPSKSSDEVIKWAISYSIGNKAAFEDAEYRRVANLTFVENDSAAKMDQLFLHQSFQIFP